MHVATLSQNERATELQTIGAEFLTGLKRYTGLGVRGGLAEENKYELVETMLLGLLDHDPIATLYFLDEKLRVDVESDSPLVNAVLRSEAEILARNKQIPIDVV